MPKSLSSSSPDYTLGPIKAIACLLTISLYTYTKLINSESAGLIFNSLNVES